MNQTGLSQILIIILVLVGLLVIGQFIYSNNLLTVRPTTVKQETLVPTATPKDLSCQTPGPIELNLPKDSSVSYTYKRIYDNDPTCFYTFTSSNFSIFIAPTGKYNEWGASGAAPNKKTYSVMIGDQLATGDETKLSNGQSSVVLEKIQGYDFGINFYDQSSETKKQVADILRTFRVTQR